MRTAIVRDSKGNWLNVILPSRSDIMDLQVGHIAPGCFRDAEVLEITARKDDLHGKAFTCYYSKFDDSGSRISYSLKEDELDRNFRLCNRYTGAELDALETQARWRVWVDGPVQS